MNTLDMSPIKSYQLTQQVYRRKMRKHMHVEDNQAPHQKALKKKKKKSQSTLVLFQFKWRLHV